MNKLSRNSKAKLSTCTLHTQEAVMYLLKFADVGVVDGGRGRKRQNILYSQKKSKLKYPLSSHNKIPSEAVDLIVYVKNIGYIDEITAPNTYRQYYGYIAGILRVWCEENNYILRWGGDWDSDADFDDQTFNDLMHFEIRPKNPK